jgi:hypothetical protein
LENLPSRACCGQAHEHVAIPLRCSREAGNGFVIPTKARYGHQHEDGTNRPLPIRDEPMKLFFSTLPRNFIKCFAGRMLLWHLLAIALTLALALSGFDWHYFLWTRSSRLWRWLFPAVPIGGLVPIVLPLSLLLLSSITRNAQVRLTAWGIGQAEAIGGIVAAGYKALTGRAHTAVGVVVGRSFQQGHT